MGLRERVPPALALLLLSPFIGECLSGSSPPLEFLNPLVFLLLAGMYGSGAILCREAVVRWGRGLPSLLLLGCAYGIAEEALAVKSFFDPHWVDIGVLGSYGRWLGVNWVWSLGLTVYHSVFSIAVPVVLVTLIYPERAREPWVGGRVLLLLFSVFVFVEALCFSLLTPYRPPVPQYIASLLTALLLIALARRLPSDAGAELWREWRTPPGAAAPPRTPLSPPPGKLFGMGTVWTLAFFILLWAGPHLLPAAPALLAAMGALLALSALLLAGARWGAGWSPRQRLALAAGLLVFLIFLGFIHELGGLRGMSAVSVSMSLFLWMMWRRLEPTGVPAGPG